MNGTLYIIGVGPGDPELMTLKAVRILQGCSIWLTPKSRTEGESTALNIASQHIDISEKTIINHRFPMKHVRRGQDTDPELHAAWKEAAQAIRKHLEQGQDVAFPTLGDPSIYSTGFYLYEMLLNEGYTGKISVIPAVSSISSAAANASMPLCLGDERLLILPATFENANIQDLLQDVDAIVFMKVYKVLDQMIELLEKENLLQNAVLVERTSLEEERIWHDVRKALDEDLHYFSTMIVRRESPTKR